LAWSALFVAVKNGHEEIVQYLVEKGADVSYQKRVSYRNEASNGTPVCVFKIMSVTVVG